MAVIATQRTTPTAVSHTWRGICWSPDLSLFCAVGSINTAGVATGTDRVMTSPDGITWTARSIDISAANTLQSVCWAPSIGRFIAVKVSGTDRVVTSSDGITWTSRPIPSANIWNDVDWSPSLSLAVAVASSGTNRSMRSSDGITWLDNAVPARTWSAVVWCASMGKFIAGSVTGGHIMWCTLGHTWTEQTGIFGTQSIAGPRAIAWSEDLGLAVAIMGSNDNPVWTSTDAITWTQRTMPTTGAGRPAWFSVCWDSVMGLFVAVGRDGATNNNQIATSPDGITWTEHDPGVATPEPWRTVTSGGVLGYAVAVADNTNNDGKSVITIEASDAPPDITSASPATGYTRGGAASVPSTITINGTGFVNGLTVLFDTTPATNIVVIGSTQITCTYPAHAAGVVNIKVTNPDSQFDTFPFTYIAPFVSTITPTHGPETGGTPVVISGDGFLTGSEIKFDGVSATAIVFVSAQTYNCTTPKHAAGSTIFSITEP